MEFLQTPVHWASLGLDPIAIQLGPLALRWYSLAYILGILFGWWALVKMAKRPDSPITPTQVDDLITWATLGVIAGGRIAYVLFYSTTDYLADPLAIFRLWEGGMSFHGGFAGVVIAVLLYCRKHGIQALRVLDYVAVVAPLGLLLGRVANFINGELWGRVTDGTWGIIFPHAGDLPRHPSQLYEAATEGLLLLILLNALFWLTNARLKPGLLGGLFVAGYGVARFCIEYVREPDAQLGILSTGLTMGQMLCLPMIFAGLWLLATAHRKTEMA